MLECDCSVVAVWLLRESGTHHSSEHTVATGASHTGDGPNFPKLSAIVGPWPMCEKKKKTPTHYAHENSSHCEIAQFALKNCESLAHHHCVTDCGC